MRVAIIPARGGSKRISHKNIKFFNGKPIIAYSIEAALKSHLFDMVVVSTDSDEIAVIAEKYGAQVPFKRPIELSDDCTGTTEVVKHAIEWFLNNDQNITQVCCIYATAPLIQINDLLEAHKMLDGAVEYVFSATEYSYPVLRSFYINEENRVKMLWPENYSKRSQDLPRVYHDAGMFYFGTVAAFLENKPFFGEYAKAYNLPNYRVQDIDTVDDWMRAEMMYNYLNQGNILMNNSN